ncbi:tetratricopeptide repeat protein [Streptomyces sp. SCSIO 30461]|uniref:tetratricopeptide repeat protein n=1 Tax=Streptomyces sp. SCSIO 30461 TaxID=3118085 RepID=UPI0030D489C4
MSRESRDDVGGDESPWGDVGELFTDRRDALDVVRQLLHGEGHARLLAFTGVSGIGKSTLLARIAAQQQTDAHVRLLDATSLLASMAVPGEGGEQAALELLRQVGRALAGSAPWWRRRWVHQQAEAIGIPRTLKARVWQWASRGALISDSPVTVTGGDPTQGQRRLAWVQDLRVVARTVRRRRCLLLIDTCEWLVFFDDSQAQVDRPRPGESLGVGGWFAEVLNELLEQAPGLRVVLAGTVGPDPWVKDARRDGRYYLHELTPWEPADTRAYLARRGLHVPDDLAGPVTERSRGLPAEVSWIADVLTGTLLDEPAADGTQVAPTALVHVEELAHGDRQEWLRTHVMARITDRNRRFLHAAAVLGTFTPQALHAVTSAPGPQPDAGNESWFEPLRRMSCVRSLPGSRGHWQLHRTIQEWLLAALAEEDTHLPEAKRSLPLLHKRAADYFEAVSGGAFRFEAAHHRFALGDPRHAAAWAAHVIRALETEPVDGLSLHLLSNAALSAPTVRDTLPVIFADAHLVRARLAYGRGDHALAYDHAEQALTVYGQAGHPGVRTAAMLAGQAAWRRDRYADAATQWTTALEALPREDPMAGKLLCALAQAVLNTGDFARGDELLSQTLGLPDPETDESDALSAAREPGPLADLCEALLVVPTADAVPAGLRRAHLHVLAAQASAHLCDWPRSSEHADRALEHADDDPHIAAHAHRIHAERAIFTWDLNNADDHVKAGLAAASDCTDQRCTVLLRLLHADLAERKAVWADPAAASSAHITAMAVTPATAPSHTANLSLAARAEAVHLRKSARKARAAARTLAGELNDPRTLAMAQIHDRPDDSLTVFSSMGDRFGQANTLRTLATIARKRNEHELAEQWATEALAVFSAIGDRFGQANTLHLLAETAHMRHDFEVAEQWATEALAVFSAIGDRFGQANTLCTLATIVRLRGDLETAEQHASEALALSHAIGDQNGQANTLRTLAAIAQLRSDFDTAEERATDALALCGSVDDPLGQATTLNLLADTARLQGDLSKAERRAENALDLYRSIADGLGEANALRILATIARLRSDLPKAEKCAREALGLYRTIGDRHGEATTLNSLAETVRLWGDLRAAERFAIAALTLHRSIDSRLGQANTLNSLAATARMLGDLPRAATHAAEALALHRFLANQPGQANSLNLLADAMRLRGDLLAGKRHATEARDIAHRIGDRLAQANALSILAETALQQGDRKSAVFMFERAAMLFEEVGADSAAEFSRLRRRVSRGDKES